MRGRGIIVVAILLTVLLCAMVAPVSAKTYYTFAGHDAVRYNNNDLTAVLRPYVDHVEYDLGYQFYSGRGVRLYYTEEGRKNIAAGNQYLLNRITYAVMSAPEWQQDRSYVSVWTEIYMHAKWGKSLVHIEYAYIDLQPWEVPYRFL